VEQGFTRLFAVAVLFSFGIRKNMPLLVFVHNFGSRGVTIKEFILKEAK